MNGRRGSQAKQNRRSSATCSEPVTVVTLFERYWRMFGGPTLETEYRFCKGRLFRFDYAHLASRTAIECEGGVMVGGWHQSTERYLTDCVKYSLAALDGWCVVRLTIAMLTEDPAFWIEAIIAAIRERSERRLADAETSGTV